MVNNSRIPSLSYRIVKIIETFGCVDEGRGWELFHSYTVRITLRTLFFLRSVTVDVQNITHSYHQGR